MLFMAQVNYIRKGVYIMYKCLLCNYTTEKRHSLPNHIHSKHKLKAKEYYDKYLKKENEDICPTCGKPNTFRNMFYGYNDHCCPQCASLDPVIIAKSKETNHKLFGYDYYVQTPEHQIKLHSNEANTKRKLHTKETFDKKYNGHPMKTKECVDKLKQTNNLKYGGNSPSNSDEVMKKIMSKVTKKSTELECYAYLCSLYNEVIREYKSELYPFKCDFYLKDTNTYIELHFFWMHGGHKYNSRSKKDKEILSEWQEKAKTIESYQRAIDIWTNRDILKYKTAKQNHLNYLVFYNINDFYEYFKQENYIKGR